MLPVLVLKLISSGRVGRSSVLDFNFSLGFTDWYCIPCEDGIGCDCIDWCWVDLTAIACVSISRDGAGCIIIDCGTVVCGCISVTLDGWYGCDFARGFIC